MLEVAGSRRKQRIRTGSRFVEIQKREICAQERTGIEENTIPCQLIHPLCLLE